MESNLLVIIVIGMITFLFNLIATHLRNSKWFTYSLRWQISILLFVIGVVGFLIFSLLNINQKGAFIILLTPLIFTTIDRFFVFLSYKYQNRDFQFNTSLEDLLNQHKKGISIWDHIITLVSLLLIIGLLIASSIIAIMINNAP